MVYMIILAMNAAHNILCLIAIQLMVFALVLKKWYGNLQLEDAFVNHGLTMDIYGHTIKVL
jgi:hypothetical protein